MANPINDVYIVAIVTRSDKTLNNYMVNLNEDLNERVSDEQMSGKRKQLDKSNEDVNISNDPNIEKPKVVEDRVEDEDLR